MKLKYSPKVWILDRIPKCSRCQKPSEVGRLDYSCVQFLHTEFMVSLLNSGLMVSALDSGSSAPGSSPGLGHCVVFLGKTLYSHGASLHPGA